MSAPCPFIPSRECSGCGLTLVQCYDATLLGKRRCCPDCNHSGVDWRKSKEPPFAGVVIGGQQVCPECGVRPSEGHVTGCLYAIPPRCQHLHIEVNPSSARDLELLGLHVFGVDCKDCGEQWYTGRIADAVVDAAAIRSRMDKVERERVNAEEALYKFMFEGDMHIVVDHASLRAWVERVKP